MSKFPLTLYVARDDAEEGKRDPYFIGHRELAVIATNAEDDEEIAVYELVSINRLTVTRTLVKKGRQS